MYQKRNMFVYAEEDDRTLNVTFMWTFCCMLEQNSF